jgi:hypothetical protein
MTIKTERYEHDALVIDVTRSKDEVKIAWTGESDSRSPGEFLNPLFARLVAESAGLAITIDFSGLKYMNSATVAPLLVSLKTFDAKAKSLLAVFSDMDWQRTHVQCIRTISRSLKKLRIEVRASGATHNRSA